MSTHNRIQVTSYKVQVCFVCCKLYAVLWSFSSRRWTNWAHQPRHIFCRHRRSIGWLVKVCKANQWLTCHLSGIVQSFHKAHHLIRAWNSTDHWVCLNATLIKYEEMIRKNHFHGASTERTSSFTFLTFPLYWKQKTTKKLNYPWLPRHRLSATIKIHQRNILQTLENAQV